MIVKAKVVARISTENHHYARIRVNGPQKYGYMKFFDLEDFNELLIGDKLAISIERVASETKEQA